MCTLKCEFRKKLSSANFTKIIFLSVCLDVTFKIWILIIFGFTCYARKYFLSLVWTCLSIFKLKNSSIQLVSVNKEKILFKKTQKHMHYSLYIYIYIYIIGPMKEKSKYFKTNRSTRRFIF